LKLVHNDENVNEMNDVNDVNCNSNQRTRMVQIHAQDAVRISTLDAGVVMKRLMVVVDGRDIRRGDTGRGTAGRGTAGRGDTGCIVRSECEHANMQTVGFRKQCHFGR
jgi:hypothetical protein